MSTRTLAGIAMAAALIGGAVTWGQSTRSQAKAPLTAPVQRDALVDDSRSAAGSSATSPKDNVEPQPVAPPAQDPGEVLRSPRPTEPPPPPPPPPVVAAPTPAPEEDPMQVVESFVQRNRKEADEKVKSLTNEAETLRARLQKVETSLERWKAVSEALDYGARPNAPPGTAIRQVEEQPAVLEPAKNAVAPAKEPVLESVPKRLRARDLPVEPEAPRAKLDTKEKPLYIGAPKEKPLFIGAEPASDTKRAPSVPETK